MLPKAQAIKLHNHLGHLSPILSKATHASLMYLIAVQVLLVNFSEASYVFTVHSSNFE